MVIKNKMNNINIKSSVEFLPDKRSQWVLYSKDDCSIWIAGD